MVFHWSLSDSKSPQVSRTRLSILAVLSNAVVWIVSTRPPTSKSSRPLNNPLVTVPNSPITIGTIVTFMFHSFFSSIARSRYLSFFSLSFRFILLSAGTAKSTILQILFLLLIIMMSALLAGIRRSVLLSLLLSFYSLSVFRISVSRWSFTWLWMTINLLMSPGLFSLFWTISIMQYFEWSPLVLISKSSSPFINLLVTIKRTNDNRYNRYFHIPQFFQFPNKVQVLIILFACFQFYSVVSRGGKVTVQQVLFFFFANYHKVWSSDRDKVIRLYLKIPEEFVRLILQDRF